MQRGWRRGQGKRAVTDGDNLKPIAPSDSFELGKGDGRGPGLLEIFDLDGDRQQAK